MLISRIESNTKSYFVHNTGRRRIPAMWKTTIGFGAALILVGIIGYFGTETSSLTALIPAGFGIVLTILGAIGRNENMRKHAMHGAAVVGLLGFLGSASGILSVLAMLRGETVERPEAAVARTVMALICLAFVALTVKSFVGARRARKEL
jgi:O-antigen/teichoic acid export membrane protein